MALKITKQHLEFSVMDPKLELFGANRLRMILPDPTINEDPTAPPSFLDLTKGKKLYMFG
jgi:hypothetical protein